MNSENIQIVATARDNASPALKKLTQNVQGLRGNLLQLSKDERLLKRTTRGIYGFSAALDVVANTRFSGLISDLTTVGLVAEPLGKVFTNLGAKLGAKFSGTFGKAVGGKGGLLAAAGIAGAIGAGQNILITKVLGLDMESKVNEAGRAMAAKFANGYTDEVKATYAKTFSQAFAAALASGATNEEAAAAGASAGQHFLSGLSTTIAANLPNDIREAFTSGNLASKFANDQALIAAGLPIGEAMAQGAGESWRRGYSVVMKTIAQDTANATKDAAAQAGQDAAAAFADRFSDNLADSLRGNKSVVKSAMHDIMWALTHPQALEHQMARIQKALQSPQLHNLLIGNPMQRLIGQQIQSRLTGQWESLTGTKYDSGVNAIVGAINSLKTYLTPGAGLSPGVGDKVFSRAGGGTIPAGAWSVVGERGPEMIRAGRQGATVSPNGGHGHNIYLNGRLVGQAVDEYLGRQLSLAPSGVINRG